MAKHVASSYACCHTGLQTSFAAVAGVWGAFQQLAFLQQAHWLFKGFGAMNFAH